MGPELAGGRIGVHLHVDHVRGGTTESSRRFHDLNPHLTYVNGWQRGYLTFDLTPDRCTANVRAVNVKDPASSVETAASFVVQAGTPGAVRA